MNLGLMGDGFILLVMGMGFVLSFLALMIIGMNFMSKIVLYLNKIFPEAIEECKSIRKRTDEEDSIALAIAVICQKEKVN